MAVARDALGTEQTVRNVSPADVTDLITVGAGATALEVSIFAISGTLAAAPIWDYGASAQTMTLIDDRVTGWGVHVYRYGLINPTAGNKTLRVVGFAADTASVNAISYTGTDTASVADAFKNVTHNAGSGLTASVTQSSTVGNIASAVHVAQTVDVTGVDQTAWFTESGASWAGNYAAGATSVTLTGSLASSANWDSTSVNICAFPPTTHFGSALFAGAGGVNVQVAQIMAANACFNAAGALSASFAYLGPIVRHTDPTYEGDNADVHVMITSGMNDAHAIEMDTDTVIARLSAGRGIAERVTIPELQARMAPDAALFDDLPDTPYVGMLHQVTDSSVNTPGATVSGGGGYRVLAWYNGSAWTVIGV